MEMRTVATFAQPDHAYLLRSHLEGSGIPAIVRDDQTITTDWALSNAIGGVKVDVPKEEYTRAMAFISATATPSPAAPEKRGRPFGLGRYVAAFLISFTCLASALAWRIGPVHLNEYLIVVGLSLIISFLIATCAGVLDL